jgi:hypothetical protein
MGNMLFGMSAFDQAHDVCGILENVAPNVDDLRLFMDDVPEGCMSRECLFISPHRSNFVLHRPV